MVQQAGIGRQRAFLVVHGVEQADDLAVDSDSPWNPNVLAESPRFSLGDRLFAVPRRAVQKQSASGADCRSQPPQHSITDENVCEGPLEVFGRRTLLLERLNLDGND